MLRDKKDRNNIDFYNRYLLYTAHKNNLKTKNCSCSQQNCEKCLNTSSKNNVNDVYINLLR
jgi:hypothetical protein